jgi:hypothetical protein
MNRLLPIAAILLVMSVSTIQAQEKANPVGTWKWKQMRGDQSVEYTAKLKMEGDKLTGVVISPGRDNENQETAISDAKFKDGEISFTVTRTFNDRKFSSKYTGKVSDDSIKGKIERERDGKSQSTDWEAKREKEKA